MGAFTPWLTHDDGRVWMLVWLGWHAETDEFEGALAQHEAARAVRVLLPALTDDEAASTVREITAVLDAAARAEGDPVAGEQLAVPKRAEAFAAATRAVATNDVRVSAVLPL